MNNDKYKKLIHQRIIQTIDSWSNQASVEEQELHRFFHSLKGTSGTIGLNGMERYSDSKEALFSANSNKTLPREEWEEHLLPLTQMFHEDSSPSPILHRDTIPVTRQVIDDNNSDRILVIDDDVEFVTYVKEILEGQHFLVSIAMNAERGLKLFYEWKPNLILLDIVLPDQDGMYVLNQIVDKAKQEHIPIIMISGYFSLENQIHAYRSGAMDFLAKPFDMELLIAIIENRFAMKRDWERSIIIDELTGAYNRKHFNRMMQQYISSYDHANRLFSIVMLDLDHFKQVNDVNDTYGHIKGDEVLQAFVSTVQGIIPQDHILCRYGGEEFALIAPNTDAVHTALLIERIRDQFNGIRFHIGDQAFQVTFSAGVAEISANNNHMSVLVEEADQALYKGKRAGRNQTVVYSKDLSVSPITSHLNVIVVDDDPVIREVLTRGFTEWKTLNNTRTRVQAYADGSNFISSDWYRADEKYMILLDGSMPNLDGIEVLRHVRENYPEQHILVIMLTARKHTTDIVNALQIGADDYVVKPFQIQELMLRIERLASRVLG